MLLVAVLVAETGLGQGARTWSELASDLNAESPEARERAIAQLKSYPNLDGELRRAFSQAHSFLATDVVLALERRDFVPDLLRLTSRPGAHFYYYAALNLLGETGGREEISKAYLQRLSSAGIESERAASLLAMIEGLARWKIPLPEGARQKLLRHRMLDVREAARKAGKGAAG